MNKKYNVPEGTIMVGNLSYQNTFTLSHGEFSKLTVNSDSLYFSKNSPKNRIETSEIIPDSGNLDITALSSNIKPGALYLRYE